MVLNKMQVHVHVYSVFMSVSLAIKQTSAFLIIYMNYILYMYK